MESTEWIPLDRKKPSALVEVALACVDSLGNVAHAIGWLTLQGEWMITAIPASDANIKEISHWCTGRLFCEEYHLPFVPCDRQLTAE